MPLATRLRWFQAAGLALVGAVALTGCGGGSGGGDPAPPRVVAALTVTPSEQTLEALGAMVQLQATARDRSGNVMSAPFSWSASDTSVVTVDSSGLVTAVANGTATVTVRSGAVSASATVTVEQTPAHIALSSEAVELAALGADAPLEASVFDANENAMTTELSWGSSDPAIVTVEADGRMTAHANGTATVTATAG